MSTGSDAPRSRATPVYTGQQTIAFDLMTTPVARSPFLDPAFGVSGVYGPVADVRPTSVTKVGSKLLVGAGGSDLRARLYRFNADGTPDTTWGTGGVLVLPAALNYPSVSLLTTDGAGRLLMTAGDAASNLLGTKVLRLLPDGTVDASFGSSGVASVTLPNYGELREIVGLADGRVVMLCAELQSGTAPSFMHVVRLTAAGQLDASFAGDGDFRFDGLPDYLATDVAVGADGRVVVSGVPNYPPGSRPGVVARLTAGGVLDGSFNGTGTVRASAAGLGGGKVLVDASHRVLLAAGTASGVGVARFLANGAVDASFGSLASNTATYRRGDGVTAVQFPQADHPAFAPDGGILVVGQVDATAQFNYDIGVARFRADGGLDTSFGNGGQFTAAVSDRIDAARGVALAGGRVVVAAALDGWMGLMGFDTSSAQPAGSVSGVVFDDRNGDGARGATEPVLAGRAVYLDANDDGTPQATERSTTTNALGGYAFTGLAAGTYRVRVATGGEVNQTTPGGGRALAVTLATGQQVAGADVGTRDGVAPVVTAAWFDYLSSPNSIRLTFSEDVSASLQSSDWQLDSWDRAGNHNRYFTNVWAVAYDKPSNTVKITFLPQYDQVFPDRPFRFTLFAGRVADATGNALAADFTFDFFQMLGDANRDRVVDFNDLLVVAQNYNTSGKTFLQGDFNYDGAVGFADLVILSQNYNVKLRTPPPLPGSALLATEDSSVFSSTPITRSGRRAKPVYE